MARNDGGAKEYQGAPKVGATATKVRANGGAKEYQPRATSRDGGAKPFAPETQTAGNGGAKEYRSAAASAAPSSAPAAAAPCVGCAHKLIVVGGMKADLRIKLKSAIDAAGAFALDLFDALIFDGSAPAPIHPTAADEPTSWEGRGFGVAKHEDGLVVTHVLGDSPAGRAGIDVGDLIVWVDNVVDPKSIQVFADRMAMTTWEKTRIVVARGSARHTIDIART